MRGAGCSSSPCPAPSEKGRGMTTRRTLHLPALLGTLAAAVLVACAVALLAVSKEAEATFPGKNGRIAYNSNGEIYTIKVGGGAKTNVTNNNRDDEDSSYSPDGKRIAYTHWDGHDLEIYTINTNGTATFQVTNNGTNEFDPSYSPDGKKIVFSGEESNFWPLFTYAVEIYTIGIHGKNRVQLTNNATYDYFPDYSPDGRRIAYSGSGKKHSGIYTISARGGDKTKVAEGGDDPDYSPDGRKIVYYTGNDLHGKIYTINVGGGGKSKVTEGSNPSWGSRP